MTLQQGIHFDVEAADYHADPAPEPSVSQSLVKVLLDQSPLHAKCEHPRLAPPAYADEDEDEKYNKAKVIGDAVHFLLLGRGKEMQVFDAPNWSATGMGKGAKAQLQEDRSAAIADGKTPILKKHEEIARAMTFAATAQLTERDLIVPFDEGGGHSEVVLVWQEGGIWRRTMIDRLTLNRRHVLDYKTTGMNAAPHAIGNLMANAGWPLQAGMHERGLDILDPENAGRRRHTFICQEQYPPYALVAYDLPESLLHMGRKRLQIGLDIWDECMRSGRWPAYPIETQYPELPGWTEQKWTAREIEHADRRREPIADDHFYGG
jgi:hypothetical protein